MATEAAVLLRGKNSPGFDPARLSSNKVTIFNVNKMAFTGKKIKQKLYRKHSGYHGGLKEKTLGEMLKQDSRIVLKKAVWGMLPKNKLRAKLIKNLILIKDKA